MRSEVVPNVDSMTRNCCDKINFRKELIISNPRLQRCNAIKCHSLLFASEESPEIRRISAIKVYHTWTMEHMSTNSAYEYHIRTQNNCNEV